MCWLQEVRIPETPYTVLLVQQQTRDLIRVIAVTLATGIVAGLCITEYLVHVGVATWR